MASRARILVTGRTSTSLAVQSFRLTGCRLDDGHSLPWCAGHSGRRHAADATGGGQQFVQCEASHLSKT